MRLDHIAYRTADRWKTSRFFIEAFDYHLQTEFDIHFPDGSSAKCIALEPPEKPVGKDVPWKMLDLAEYHLPPEIFVSDGTPDSIVGQWVAARDGVGGIHHMAYQVESVQDKMEEWRSKGYAEFASEKPLTCPGLTQVFTKPSELTGVIYEFIERGAQGFCRENVQKLMESTKGF
jgi:hypothetical protein